MFLAVLVFTITAGFLLLGNAKNAFAGNCHYIHTGETAVRPDQGVASREACNKLCLDAGSTTHCNWFDGTKTLYTSGEVDLTPSNGPFEKAFAWLLTVVLTFTGKLLSISGTLFAMIVDVNNFKAVFYGATLYEVWKLVRDFLNIAFILVLLYSAFCTILQIESYNYKKILLKLVIMALLVNFSFPITRFIIDASNVLMYTIISTLFGATINSQFANITHGGGIDAILALNSSASIPNLLAAIVFVFILAITLLAIGILLVIRLVVLAMLLIFSPLAFVATIFPDTGGYSSKWWDNLFKYSFFGPIMLFVIYIATQMLAAASTLRTSALNNAQNHSIDPGIIGTMAFFTVPIVILWMGMGMAASMSGAAGSAVMGGAQKFIGKVGKFVGKAPFFVGKAPFKGAWWGMKKTGIPGGVQQKWKSVTDKWDASQKSKEARVAARLGVTGATVKDAETRAADYEKNHESDASLIIKTEAGDAGAALALVKRGKMDDKIYGNFVSNNKDASLKEHVAKKVKKNRVDILIKYGQSPDKILEARQKIATESGRALATITDDMAKARLADNEMKKLSPEDIKSQYWGAILDGATPDIERAAKKMFAGIAPEAREEIAKGQSSSNRESVNKLRDGGFI